MIDSKQLRIFYEDKNMSMDKIGKILGIGKGSVQYRLIRAGIKIRKVGRPAKTKGTK